MKFILKGIKDDILIFAPSLVLLQVSQVVLVVKTLPGRVGDSGDTGLVPGLGRSPGGGNDSPLQYCLENPMDSGAWRGLQSMGSQRVGRD